MEANTQPELTEQQRLQQQFQLFQESLPKVSVVPYQLLLNQIVPLSVSIQNNLDTSSNETTDEEISTEDLAKSVEQNLTMNPKLMAPSHRLIGELYTSQNDKRQQILNRLSSIGFQIGNKLTELLIFSNNPNLHFDKMDLLTVMKFICRDVWRQLFGKQIDNLKTNHRGTFYLFDYEYKPIQDFALDEQSTDKELEMVEPYLEIPCGVIRGVLASLGFQREDQVTCHATFVDLPPTKSGSFSCFPKGVSFNVQIELPQYGDN